MIKRVLFILSCLIICFFTISCSMATYDENNSDINDSDIISDINIDNNKDENSEIEENIDNEIKKFENSNTEDIIEDVEIIIENEEIVTEKNESENNDIIDNNLKQENIEYNNIKENDNAIIENSPKSYTDEELYVLSHVIFAEAGNHSRELQIGVGSVVLNRVADERFPNTIKEVVFQKGQYACTWSGSYYKEPTEEAIDAAIYLLENGSQYPVYCIFQAEFLQGDSVYKQVGNTYFCYWSKDVK